MFGTDPARSPIAGFLLAGGLSSRMGTNKAFLLFQGESLIERSLRKLHQVCSPVAIAGGVPALAAFGSVIEDRTSGNGPLGGIVAALEQTTAEWNLFIAVDMPLLPVRVLQQLIGGFDQSSLVTLARAEGQVQPLCGIYARQALPVLRAELEKGNRRVRAAAEATGALTYWQAQNPAWFTNVNTPEEFAAAEKLAESTAG